MTNRYEMPEVLDLGKARDVIEDQKQPDVTMDWLDFPYCTEAPTIDDFDE